MNIAIGVTGASGTIYARRLIEKLSQLDITITVIFSEYGEQVARYEGEFELISSMRVKIISYSDLFHSVASGSSRVDGVVVVPCSASTMGRIANSTSNNLITRAADVMLKERRKLIIALRETPLSLLHIENMQKLTLAGGIVMPLSPSFYSKPATIEELVDTQVERIISLLGIECERYVFE